MARTTRLVEMAGFIVPRANAGQQMALQNAVYDALRGGSPVTYQGIAYDAKAFTVEFGTELYNRLMDVALPADLERQKEFNQIEAEARAKHKAEAEAANQVKSDGPV